MADNVAITAGSGTTVATDDVSGVHYQRVKLVDGTLDADTAIAAGNGTNGGALRVTIASDTTGVVAVTDNSGSLTVDGTVGVTAGTGVGRPDNHGATLVTKTAQYTSTQTGTALWTPAGGKKVVITYYQIQATGTTGGDVQLWFGASGDTTYTRGTDAAVFDGNLIPSATMSPGVVIALPVPLVGAADYVLRVTDSAAINALTVTVWGFEV